jgi:hypothetical protein
VETPAYFKRKREKLISCKQQVSSLSYFPTLARVEDGDRLLFSKSLQVWDLATQVHGRQAAPEASSGEYAVLDVILLQQRIRGTTCTHTTPHFIFCFCARFMIMLTTVMMMVDGDDDDDYNDDDDDDDDGGGGGDDNNNDDGDNDDDGDDGDNDNDGDDDDNGNDDNNDDHDDDDDDDDNDNDDDDKEDDC